MNSSLFAVSCPPFTQIPKGTIKGTGRKHGAFIQFTCNDGFQLSGASSAWCNDGRWSEPGPQCLGWYKLSFLAFTHWILILAKFISFI